MRKAMGPGPMWSVRPQTDVIPGPSEDLRKYFTLFLTSSAVSAAIRSGSLIVVQVRGTTLLGFVFVAVEPVSYGSFDYDYDYDYDNDNDNDNGHLMYSFNLFLNRHKEQFTTKGTKVETVAA